MHKSGTFTKRLQNIAASVFSIFLCFKEREGKQKRFRKFEFGAVQKSESQVEKFGKHPENPNEKVCERLTRRQKNCFLVKRNMSPAEKGATRDPHDSEFKNPANFLQTFSQFCRFVFKLPLIFYTTKSCPNFTDFDENSPEFDQFLRRTSKYPRLSNF